METGLLALKGDDGSLGWLVASALIEFPSLSAASRHANVSTPTLLSWRSNAVTPTEANVFSVARAFGKDAHEWLRRAGYEPLCDDGSLSGAVREAVLRCGGIEAASERSGIVRTVINCWIRGSTNKNRPLALFRFAVELDGDPTDILRRAGFVPNELFLLLLKEMAERHIAVGDLTRMGFGRNQFHCLSKGRLPNRSGRKALRRFLQLSNLDMEALLAQFPTMHTLREAGKRLISPVRRRGGIKALKDQGKELQARYGDELSTYRTGERRKRLNEERRGLLQQRSFSGRVGLLFCWRDPDGNVVPSVRYKPVGVYGLRRQADWSLCRICNRLNLAQFHEPGYCHLACAANWRKSSMGAWLPGVCAWRREGKNLKDYLENFGSFPVPAPRDGRRIQPEELAETLGWCLRHYILGHSLGRIAEEHRLSTRLVADRIKYFMLQHLPPPGLGSKQLALFVRPLQAFLIARFIGASVRAAKRS